MFTWRTIIKKFRMSSPVYRNVSVVDKIASETINMFSLLPNPVTLSAMRLFSSGPDFAFEVPMTREIEAAIESHARSVEERHKALCDAMADQEVHNFPDRMISINKEIASLESSVASVRALRAKSDEVDLLRAMANDSSEEAELIEMAEAELQSALAERESIQRRIVKMILPRDDAESRNCILEVRAGSGGEEASLFAMRIFRMYEKYSEINGWKFDIDSITESELGGYKEASASISGEGAFGRLQFESGVHRVQRVPVTEKSGRVHTSASSVVVLPVAEEVDVQIRNEDLRIDTYRSGGAGGQSVNTTSSAVRITHLPTGVVVAIQDERSQHQNKAKALKILRAKLYDMERQQRAASRSQQRNEQIGSGDRSERVRTYNFPQGRVTDHRINLTVHSLDKVLEGDGLDEVLDALMARREMDLIAQVLKK